MKRHLLSPTNFNFLPRLKVLPLSNFFRFGVLLALALTLFGTGISNAQSSSANLFAVNYGVKPKSVSTYYAIELRVFELVNNERIKNGRAPLEWTDQVARIARYHSSDMVQRIFFGHEDPDGRRPSSRAEFLGLKDWRDIGENIAWLRGAVDPAQHVVERWMLSPGHRENILDKHYKESGIGVARNDEGSYYFTQVFIRRK